MKQKRRRIGHLIAAFRTIFELMEFFPYLQNIDKSKYDHLKRILKKDTDDLIIHKDPFEDIEHFEVPIHS